MHALHRLSLSIAAVATAWAGLEQVHPGWVNGLGNGLGQIPIALEKVFTEAQRHEVMQETLAAVKVRSAAKARLAREVFAGRLTVALAAERFAELDAQPPVVGTAILETQLPGRTDEERRVHEVLLYVDELTRGNAAGAAAFRRRWQAEWYEPDEYPVCGLCK